MPILPREPLLGPLDMSLRCVFLSYTSLLQTFEWTSWYLVHRCVLVLEAWSALTHVTAATYRTVISEKMDGNQQRLGPAAS